MSLEQLKQNLIDDLKTHMKDKMIDYFDNNMLGGAHSGSKLADLVTDYYVPLMMKCADLCFDAAKEFQKESADIV